MKNNNIDRIVFKYDPKDGTVIAFLPDEAAPPGLNDAKGRDAFEKYR